MFCSISSGGKWNINFWSIFRDLRTYIYEKLNQRLKMQMAEKGEYKEFFRYLLPHIAWKSTFFIFATGMLSIIFSTIPIMSIVWHTEVLWEKSLWTPPSPTPLTGVFKFLYACYVKSLPKMTFKVSFKTFFLPQGNQPIACINYEESFLVHFNLRMNKHWNWSILFKSYSSLRSYCVKSRKFSKKKTKNIQIFENFVGGRVE